MSEIVHNALATVSFLSLSIYATYVIKSATKEATKGLTLVRDGFALAAALSLIWMAPFQTFGPSTVTMLNALSVVAVTISLLVALRGMTVWYAHTEVEREQRRSLTKRSAGKKGNPATDQSEASDFVESCYRWAESQRTRSSPKTVAQSFLMFIRESTGIQATSLAVADDTDPKGQLTLATSPASGMRAGIQPAVFQAEMKSGISTKLTLLCDSAEISSARVRELTIGLNTVNSILELQSLKRRLSQVKRESDISRNVRNHLHLALKRDEKEKEGLPQLHIPHLVYEVVSNTVNSLTQGMTEGAGTFDFIAVESSAWDSGMTVAFSRSVAAGQPRIGLYPLSRRLRFSDSSQSGLSVASNEATLLQRLPVYDSRPGWRRITAERLQSLIYGSFVLDETSLVTVVIGSRTQALDETARGLLSCILRELQPLIGLISQHTTQKEPQETLPTSAPASWRVSSELSQSPLPTRVPQSVETEDVFV